MYFHCCENRDTNSSIVVSLQGFSKETARGVGVDSHIEIRVSYRIMYKILYIKPTKLHITLQTHINGCGEDLYVSHASVKRNFGGHRKDCAIQDSACLEFGRALTEWKWTFEKRRMVLLVYLIYFTKREKKMYGFLALYALRARKG